MLPAARGIVALTVYHNKWKRALKKMVHLGFPPAESHLLETQHNAEFLGEHAIRMQALSLIRVLSSAQSMTVNLNSQLNSWVSSSNLLHHIFNRTLIVCILCYSTRITW